MANLGWQRMCNIYPYIDGQAFSDSITRTGNTINYSINLGLMTPTYKAYWNYAWYVDMQVGNNVSNGRQVKEMVYYNQIIQGNVYYQSTFNGNFTGSIGISGKEDHITLRAYFHDSFGNHGHNTYWNIPIPQATPIMGLESSVSDIQPDSATITAKINDKGSYATITRWRLECNGQTYDSDTDTMSTEWTLTDLEPDTSYDYKITVWNSTGYDSTYDGKFKTLEDIVGYIITPESTKEIKGWIIEPNGNKRKIKNIRKVE